MRLLLELQDDCPDQAVLGNTVPAPATVEAVPLWMMEAINSLDADSVRVAMEDLVDAPATPQAALHRIIEAATSLAADSACVVDDVMDSLVDDVIMLVYSDMEDFLLPVITKPSASTSIQQASRLQLSLASASGSGSAHVSAWSLLGDTKAKVQQTPWTTVAYPPKVAAAVHQLPVCQVRGSYPF